MGAHTHTAASLPPRDCLDPVPLRQPGVPHTHPNLLIGVHLEAFCAAPILGFKTRGLGPIALRIVRREVCVR
jgi:hypothetical protein